LLAIAWIFQQNNKLANMFLESRGKTRALFGIMELNQLDVKIYIGLIVFLGLILWFFGLRKRECKVRLIIAALLICSASLLLFIRLWTYMV
jgi:hypothetical protein